MQKLSEKEIRLLALAEQDLPLSLRPFDDWGASLGLSADQVVATLAELKRRGVIRDFRAVLRHQQAVLKCNAMLALSLSDELIAETGAKLASRDWVPHCYERPDFRPYSLFAMVHARSEDELSAHLAELVALAGGADHRVYRSIREFKKTSMRYAAYYLKELTNE